MSLSDLRCNWRSRIRWSTLGSVGGVSGLLLATDLAAPLVTDLPATLVLTAWGGAVLLSFTVDLSAGVFFTEDFFSEDFGWGDFWATTFLVVAFGAIDLGAVNLEEADLAVLGLAVFGLDVFVLAAVVFLAVEESLLASLRGAAVRVVLLAVEGDLFSVATEFFGAALAAGVDLGALAVFEALATATNSSSFRMELLPATPKRFANLAKSVLVWNLRSADVITIEELQKLLFQPNVCD